MIQLTPEPDAFLPLYFVLPFGRMHRDILGHAHQVVRVVGSDAVSQQQNTDAIMALTRGET
jgi:hypothetical protein